MKNLPDKRPDDTWVQIDETIGTVQAEVIAGLLRSFNIPVYVESDTLAGVMFGQFAGSVKIFVPEIYHERAIFILEQDDDDSLLDEPEIES